MRSNPIEEVLEELKFTNVQKEGFIDFLNYAKTCQETGNNKQMKSRLEEIVNDISKKM